MTCAIESVFGKRYSADVMKWESDGLSHGKGRATKALIKVGYTCNNNCVFCHSRPLRRHPDLTADEIRSRITLAKKNGAKMAVFSGGEPTVRPDLLELARFARAGGLKTGLITNGRRFVYPDFGKALFKAGLRFVYFSFHSHRPETHELTTRTPSFRQTLGALKNLSELGVALTVNTVVTKHNIGSLPAVVDRLAPFKPDKIKFSVVEPKGAALESIAAVCPPLGASATAIAKAIRYGRSRYPHLSFGCEGLTPCLLEDFDRLNNDLISNDFTTFQETFEGDFSPPDYLNRSKAAVCFDCAWIDRCPGVFAEYLSMKPATPLRPKVRPRSNSFVFVKKGKSRVPSARRPASDIRRIFLKEKGRLQAYETRTGDFSDAEIAETLRLGQVYVTSDGRHTNLDFGRDLIKLRLARPHPPIFETGKANVFAPLEAALKRIVSKLKGKVLDIGCGTVRFRETIEAGVRAKRLKYVGIDPHPPRGRTPAGMRLLRRTIEDFKAPAASFDHILILRSYNHIRLPSAAFPKIRRMLKPSGRLTIVDGTAFALALARTPPSADPAAFEHFRNHSSRQAKALLEYFGFTTLKESPVRPSGSNEWLLVLK